MPLLDHFGPRVEVDVATFGRRAPDPIAPETREAMPAFRPEPPEGRVAVTFPDEFETRVLAEGEPRTLLLEALESVVATLRRESSP